MIGGTTAFVSGVAVFKGEIVGKLALSVDMGSTGLETLFGIKPGGVSGASAIDGAGGSIDGIDGKVEAGKDIDAKLREPVVEGSRGGGYSGKFGPGKLTAPVGKEALNPGYCIGCCIEGGIDSPGGGLSKDCWCN